METRIRPASIVRGLLVLSLVSLTACETNQAGSLTQPTPLTAEDRSSAVPVDGNNEGDAQATVNQEQLPAQRGGEQLEGSSVVDARVSVPQRSTTAAAQADYGWEIDTCNTGDAGTDANMYFYVSGTAGSTGWMLLDNPYGNDFERGHHDVFSGLPTLRGQINVNQPYSFTVYNDRAGDKPGWALCTLKLTIRAADGTVKTRTFNPAGAINWVDSNYGWMRTFYS
jgi:PLAT/LH2 domain